MEDGRLSEACQKFAESLALVRRGGTLLNLAVCRDAQGRSAVAFRLFEEARDMATRDGREDRVTLAVQHMEALRPHLAWLRVQVPRAEPGQRLVVACDGEDLPPPTWGVPYAIEPSSHTIRATAPGYVAFETTISGAAGGTITLSIPALAPVPTVPAAEPPSAPVATDAIGFQAPEPPHWKQPLGWTALGVGAATVVTGGIFGVLAIVDSTASKGQCPALQCTDAGFEKNQMARTEANVANVTIPVGLALAAVGVYFLATSRAGKSAPRPPASGRTAASFELGWPGLLASGRW